MPGGPIRHLHAVPPRSLTPIRGGGYLNAATRRFLDAYQERHGELPPEARKSWGAPKADPTLPLFEDA